MILFLPSILLLITASAVAWLQKFRPHFNGSWLTAVVGSSLAVITLIYLRFRLPSETLLISWQGSGLAISDPGLLLDYYSWPYAFSLVVLMFAITLASPMVMRSRAELVNLAGSLAITGVSLIPVMAGNPATILLGWSALDMIEVIVLLRNNPRASANHRIIRGFIFRFLGSLLAFWAFILVNSGSIILSDYTHITPWMGLALLLAASLRLGVIPAHIPYGEQVNIRRSQGNIFRFTAAASSLVIVSRVPVGTFQLPIIDLVKVIMLIAVGFATLKLLRTTVELDTRPYWVLAMSGLALLATINGSITGATSLGVTLILTGGLIYMHPAVTRFSRWLIYLGILLAAGIPFFPSASGLAGLMASPSLLNELVTLILFTLTLIGLLQRGKNKADFPSGDERIVYLTHPLSLLAVLMAYLGIGFFGWPGSMTAGAWPAVVLASASSGVVYLVRKPLRAAYLSLTVKGKAWFGHFQPLIQVRRWVGRVDISGLQQGMISLFRLMVTGLSFLLEGPGGLLWGLILMVILVMAIGGVK
jgi:hypothetical protein